MDNLIRSSNIKTIHKSQEDIEAVLLRDPAARTRIEARFAILVCMHFGGTGSPIDFGSKGLSCQRALFQTGCVSLPA